MHQHSHTNAPRVRRFAITVDGVRHEVVVEELATESGPSGQSEPRASAAVVDGSGAVTESGNGALDDGWVVAPMPGTVTEIVANVGDTVNRGDVIVILTAMKLENEITAPLAGVIRALQVNEGDNVNNGDRLVQLSTEEANS